MSLKRPKILTAVTIPASTWTFKIYISVAAQFDTPITASIPAGTWYVSGDSQTDDIVRHIAGDLSTLCYAAMTNNAWVILVLNAETHKTEIYFVGSNFTGATKKKVRLAFSEWTEDLCDALGFDTSDVDLTTDNSPMYTGPYHHAFGWYADEDGQLGDVPTEDVSNTDTMQSVSISGRSKGQCIGGAFTSYLRLQFLERDFGGRTKVFSRNVGYGAASVHPYNRNEPLECWWLSAIEGTQFRVYHSGYLSTGQADDATVPTAQGWDGSAYYMEQSDKSWSTDPQRWLGCILWAPSFLNQYDIAAPVKVAHYIASNTAIRLTQAVSSWWGWWMTPAGSTCYLFDHRYQTYVLNTEKGARFAPAELAGLDRYNVVFPLKRYVA